MSRWMRVLGIVVGVVIVAVAALAIFVTTASKSATARTFDVALIPFPVVRDSATDSVFVARGEHLATAVANCIACHGADMGGQTVIDDPGMGYIAAPNLTTGPGGVIAPYTDAELERAIRNGVRRDGHGLAIMPSDEYQMMTDYDVAALIGYIHTLPPVNRTMLPMTLRAVGRTLVAFKLMPMYAADRIDHDAKQLVENVADTTVEYGQYLANVGGCTGCHGATLSGGPMAGMSADTPPAANLTPSGIGEYTDEQVESMLRTGRRPDGTVLNSLMPWTATAKLSALEMTAILKYLRSVAPHASGER